MTRRAKTALAVACLLPAGAVLSGCGSSGVASDATVTAYVEASLCSAAQQELRKRDGRAGELRVRAVCVSSPHQAKRLDLATVGANARQATEDSTAVVFLEAPDPKAARFTHPILEAAEIPWIANSSGTAAMKKLLRLIESAGSGSLRKQLREDLQET